MLDGAFGLRQQVLGIQNSQADAHQNARQSEAEGNQKRQTEANAADRNRAQQQHQRGWAGDQSAARAECEQTAHRDRTFGHVAVATRSMVVIVIVIVAMIVAVLLVSVIVLMMGMAVIMLVGSH